MNLDTPRGALESLEQAIEADDTDAFTACVDPRYAPAYSRIVTVMNKFRSAAGRVVKAAEAQFGAEAIAPVRAALSGIRPPSPLCAAASDGRIDWEQVRIDEEGDQAAVRIRDYPVATLHKADGRWYVLPGEVAGRSPEELGDEAEAKDRQGDQAAAALAELEQQVTRGEVNPDDLMPRIGQAMQAGGG